MKSTLPNSPIPIQFWRILGAPVTIASFLLILATRVYPAGPRPEAR